MIAIVAGCVFGVISISHPITELVKVISILHGRGFALVYSAYYSLTTLIIAFLIYGLLTRYLAPSKKTDNETHCRKCQYILKGISEPICPECGERI
jgi:uncharacterized paraquat-inducible protein A